MVLARWPGDEGTEDDVGDAVETEAVEPALAIPLDEVADTVVEDTDPLDMDADPLEVDADTEPKAVPG